MGRDQQPAPNRRQLDRGWAFAVVALGSPWTVCPACPLHGIQQAINAVPAGAQVIVKSGVYRESEITIDHPVTLIGEGDPIVDGEKKSDIFIIKADGVRIAGFTLQNSGVSYVKDLAAIQVVESSDCRIEENHLINNFFSIHLAKSRNCVISGNRIERTEERAESALGNGIHIWSGQNITIRGNDITGQRDGIYFEFVSDSHIEGNRSHGNRRYGLHFMFSDRDEYRDNIFARNEAGVAVMYSKGIQMYKNRFEDSWGASAYGLLLKDISASEVNGNVFSGNTVGIFMESSSRSRFFGNRFLRNGWALRILGSCEGDTFTRNDFIRNTFEVSTNTSNNFNQFHENYWSGYRGLDLDQDGIGDTPYRPVRLSAIFMEKVGVSVLLLKSFFFSVVDQAEAALPVLTPEGLSDDRPLMQPVTGGAP